MRLAALVLTSAALAAAQPTAPAEALARLQQKTANLPPALALDFRMLAAQSLHKSRPELARDSCDRRSTNCGGPRT